MFSLDGEYVDFMHPVQLEGPVEVSDFPWPLPQPSLAGEGDDTHMHAVALLAGVAVRCGEGHALDLAGGAAKLPTCLEEDADQEGQVGEGVAWTGD